MATGGIKEYRIMVGSEFSQSEEVYETGGDELFSLDLKAITKLPLVAAYYTQIVYGLQYGLLLIDCF